MGDTKDQDSTNSGNPSLDAARDEESSPSTEWDSARDQAVNVNDIISRGLDRESGDKGK